MRRTTLLATLALILGFAAEPVAADGIPWVRDVAAAKKQAQAEKKELFVFFTGSDWCHWCKVLHEEVLDKPEFMARLGDRFVFLYLDFPRSEEARAKVGDPAVNDRLKGEYGIQGFPSIVLSGPGGEPYATAGYRPGGVESYLAYLTNLLDKAQPIRDMLEKPEPDAALMAKAFSRLIDQRLLGHPAYAKYLERAKKIDVDGKKGLRVLVDTALQNAAFDALVATMPRDREPTDAEWGKVVELLQDSPLLSGRMFAQVAYGVGIYLFDHGRYAEAKQMFVRAKTDPEVAPIQQAQREINSRIAKCDEKLGEGGGGATSKPGGDGGGSPTEKGAGGTP